MIHQNSRDVRTAIEIKWNRYLSEHANLFSSDSLSGSSPPSVFVGAANYPQVLVGPLVPPVHGDTALLDTPEQWMGKSLEDIVNYRLQLVRGIKKVAICDVENRYIQDLQDVAMASRPIDSELEFVQTTTPNTVSVGGEAAPFGPVGNIRSVHFSNVSPQHHIQKVYYDRDLDAKSAVLQLYNSGVEISKIQKCFSAGMLGEKRRLVPTRWSITATDDIISNSHITQILDFCIIDHFQTFQFSHLGNIFSIILFPHRWLYEMIEAWYSFGGILGFGSDYEDARGFAHGTPAIAGAYFAARLGVSEYLLKIKQQAGVLVLREIRPEYAVPVGVWQIRQGVRAALENKPVISHSLDDAISTVCGQYHGVSKQQWLEQCNTLRLLKQKSISDYF